MEEKTNKRPLIKPIDLEILSIVRTEPMSATEIGHLLKKNHNYILHVSSRMRSNGLVSLEKSQKDGRKKQIIPTRRGLIILGVSKAKETKKQRLLEALDREVGSKLRDWGLFIEWGI